MPAPGAAYTLGSDEPKEKDIVWALVDGTLWMPARVDQPNVPPPASSQDPSGARYCKAKFFQRLPDGKSSRVVRWATRVAPPPAAVADDDDVSDDDGAMLFGRVSAPAAAAAAPSPPELLAFDLTDAEKCGVAAVRESVDKLRDYFAKRGGGGGGHTPQKEDAPPRRSATTTTSSATKAPSATTAKPAAAAAAPSVRAAAPSRKGPAAAVAARVKPERESEEDDVGSPAPPAAPAAPPKEKGRPPPAVAKVPTAPPPLKIPAAKTMATTTVVPPAPAASTASKPLPRRRAADTGRVANDDDDPFEGSIDDVLELPPASATPSGAARAAATVTAAVTAAAPAPKAVPPAKVPAARKGPAAAAAAAVASSAAKDDSASDSDDVPIAQLLAKKGLPPPQPPAQVTPAAKAPSSVAIAKKIPSPPPTPRSRPAVAAPTPACAVPVVARITALAVDTGADDEVGLAGLMTAVLSLADVTPSTGSDAAGAAVPCVFAARHAFAPTLLLGSPAFVQSVTAAHVDALRAFAEAGGADVDEAAATTAGAAILGALARAWPVGAVTDDGADDMIDLDTFGAAADRAAAVPPPLAMPGFDLMSGVVLPSEPTRVSPLLPLLMFHGSWRVRAWARSQVSAFDPTLLGPTDAALAWAVVTLFAASELTPGMRPLPSAEAMLPTITNVNDAVVSDALRALRDTVANKVPASEVAEAASALVALAAALVALAAKCSAGSPLRRVSEMALATSIAAVATSDAGEATKAAGDAAGRAVADALPAGSTPKNQWVDPAQLARTCDILADWCATATARVTMSAATGDPTQWRCVDASRILALAALRRALDPAVSLVHTAAVRAGRRSTASPLPRAISPSAPIASRVRARDAPLLLALERLAARLKDKEVCGTSAAQLAGMAAWLHAHVAVVWGSLASGANAAFTAGAGSELLCDLNADPYVTAEGTVPPACPGYLQPHQAAHSLVASVRNLGALVCSPAAAHAWAFDVGSIHAPLFDKLLGVRDPPAATGTAASATPAPTAIARSMCAAALLGTVLLDATAAFHRDVMWEALQPKGDYAGSGAGGGSAPLVPPAFSLAAYWDVLKPAHRPQLRQPLLACLLFDPWAALFDASAASGGSGTGLAEVAKRVGVVAESMRSATRRAAADEHRGFDSEDIFAIAAVRSLTNAGSPALAASDTSNDGPFRRAVAAAVDSLAFASCRATANMSAVWRVAATQRGASEDAVGAAAALWPAAAWAVRRELAHVVPAHGGTTRARELLVSGAGDAGWAAATEAISGAASSTRVMLAPLQTAELAASARHAWVLVVVAVAWGTTAAKRDRLLRAATKLPPPTSAALLPLLHRRAGLFLPTGTLPELLVLAAASTATPLPESTLDRTLALIKTLPAGTRGNVQRLAREAGCAWLADLASGSGVYEAQAAAASARETENRFAQFERMEQQYNREQQRNAAEEWAVNRPRSIRDRLNEAPALHAAQMAERRRQRDAEADERRRMQAAQRGAVVISDGGSSSGDDAEIEAVGQSRRPQPAAAPPKAVPPAPPAAPHPLMQPKTIGGAIGQMIKLPANYKLPVLPSLQAQPAPMPGGGPGRAAAPAGTAVKTAMTRRDEQFERERATTAVDRAVDSAKAALARCILATPLEGSALFNRNVSRATARRRPAKNDGRGGMERGPSFSDALGDLGVPETGVDDDDRGERGAVDCLVVSPSAPCSVARTWPDLSSDRAINAVHAGEHNSPHALASFVTRWLPFIAAEARGEVVSTLRKLLQVSRTGGRGGNNNSNSNQRGGGGNRPGETVATPGGLSEYLGVARLAAIPRVAPASLVVELSFVQDSRADKARDARPAERTNEHDILVINFARVGAGAPAPGSNDAWPPLFAFEEDGSTSSGGVAKQHRAEGDAVASKAASARPSPAGSDADADPDDVALPPDVQSRASVVGVVDAPPGSSSGANRGANTPHGPRTTRRSIFVRVSKDCPNLRAALEALAFVDPNDHRAGLRVYRISSLATANAQIEACGKVCLMKDLWPVISDPRQHLARSDVAAAATRLAAAIARDPTLPPNTRFNTSQIEAMNAAVAERGDSAGTRLSSFDQSLLPFALVQGPPGTGKTHTIVGLIVRWLTAHQTRDRDARDGVRSRKRVLVVAPSNIAVDEVALCLMQVRIAVPGGGDRSWAPVCVRLGTRDSVDPDVLGAGIFIDDCVRRANCSFSRGNRYMHRTPDVFQGGANPRHKVLVAADVVLTTIGSIRGASGMSFPFVVADDAATATEPMLYTALAAGAERAVLIGDPAQQKATVLSPAAARRRYGRSLMERLVAAGYPCHMLDTQYRMHPDISGFPNAAFYGGRTDTREYR